MRVAIALIVAMTLGCIGVDAQKYNTALGARFGNDLGISISQRLEKKTSIMLIHEVGLYADLPSTYIMALSHVPIFSKRVNMFVGGGMFGRRNLKTSELSEDFWSYGPAIDIGLDFTIGRCNIALDYLSHVVVGRTNGRRFDASSGISIRYVLWQRKSKVKSWRERTSERWSKIFKNKKD